MINRRRLDRIARVIAPLMLGGAVMADATWGYDGSYNAADFFPFGLGNAWTIKRTVTGGTEAIELVSDRLETVNGNPTTVFQVRTGIVLREEWYLSVASGIRVHRVRFFEHEFQGTTTDIDATFNPALPVTDNTPTLNEQIVSSGSVGVQFSALPSMTAPYAALSQVMTVGEVVATPGAISEGTRTTTTLVIPGTSPLGGSLTADIFWGRNLGPISMSFSGALGGKTLVEKKWLENTNVDREDTILVAAHSPTTRATTVGGIVTAFATVINAGPAPATWCKFAPLPGSGGLPLKFNFYESDSSNQIISGPNLLFGLDPFSSKNFVFSMETTAAFPTRIFRFVHDCWESPPAPRFPGVTDFRLTSTAAETTDILTVGIAAGGIVDLSSPVAALARAVDNRAPSNTVRIGAFAAATINLGAKGTVTISGAPVSPATPVTVTVCPTDPATAQCLQDPAPEVVTEYDPMATFTYSFFVTAEQDVPFDPGNHRVEARAIDQQGNQVGGWSAAVRTIP